MQSGRLSKPEIDLFFKLYHSLLYFVNIKHKFLPTLTSREEIVKTPPSDLLPLREKAYSSPQIIDEFVVQNPSNLSAEEVNIVSSWKKHLREKFFILGYKKEHTLFYSSDKVFGVLALNTPFEELLGPYLPVIAEAVLLPFNGKIVYDSFIIPFNISMGRSMQKIVDREAAEAMQKFGIVASLDMPVEEKTVSDEETLRFYLKSKENRDHYAGQIDHLASKSPLLAAIFHQEEGKRHAKRLRAKLRTFGAKGYFAVIDDMVVASAESQEQLRVNLARILSKEKIEWAYYFGV